MDYKKLSLFDVSEKSSNESSEEALKYRKLDLDDVERYLKKEEGLRKNSLQEAPKDFKWPPPVYELTPELLEREDGRLFARVSYAQLENWCGDRPFYDALDNYLRENCGLKNIS